MLSFEPVSSQPRSSSICCRPFFTGFGHFQGSTRFGLFKWQVLWGTALQQSPASCHEHCPDFPRPYKLWKSLPSICLDLYAHAIEPSFGFCWQHLEFPCGIPSKYSPTPMLLLLTEFSTSIIDHVDEMI